MWNEQLLLLALLAALFLSSSSQNPFEDDEISDHCQLKTSIVLHKLDTFEREKMKDDFKRNQLCSDEVKETISVMMKQQQEQSKSQLDQFENKLDNKVKETMGAMLKQQQEESKSQMDLLTKKFEKVEKMEETLELVKTQVQQNAHLIKLIPECLGWLQTRNLDRTNFFSAEGQYFYFNKTLLTWNEARDWCAERGMQMAMLKTTSQMDAVAKELKKHTPNYWYWMGASDVGQTAGWFRWADGTLVDGTTWHNGKIYKYIGDSTEKTCVDFSTKYTRLSDARCSWGRYILCQVPAALALFL